MMYLTAAVRMHADLEIGKMGELISRRYFGDIKFERADVDELVSLRLASSLAGQTFRLAGVRPYYVFAANTDFVAAGITVPDKYELIDCTEYYSFLLGYISEVQIC